MSGRALLLLLLLTGCTGLPSLGWFPATLDDRTLHEEVFAESYRRLTTYYLEPVALDRLVPDGLQALRQLDPRLPLPAGPQPASQDWQGWASVTYASLMASPTLKALPPEQVYQTFFPALLAKLDGFSHYLPPEETSAREEWRTGYGGIGVTFERRGSAFVIIDVFIGSPAALAGLRAGENVLAIDGTPTGNLSGREFANRVRGPTGTPLVLTVARRGGPPRQVTVTRARVTPTTVSLNMTGEAALLRISRFMPTTVAEFRRAARQAVWSGARAVVLDLQHNPGGYLESATEIGALLVPRGLVASTRGRHPGAYHEYRAGGADILNGLPLFVLVDGHTASAAEVLAAALQDTGRGRLIGSTTFGKGSVQNVGPLPHGGELAVTWARLHSPRGRSWIGSGLQPDTCVLNVFPCPKADDVEAQALPAALRAAGLEKVNSLDSPGKIATLRP